MAVTKGKRLLRVQQNRSEGRGKGKLKGRGDLQVRHRLEENRRELVKEATLKRRIL